MIALSDSSETLWVQWARRGPDGRWDLVDSDEIPYRFYPYVGTWGYALIHPTPGWWVWRLARVEASGRKIWEIDLPEGVHEATRVDPDGRLRMKGWPSGQGWIVEPDGSFRPDPLGWPEEAIPGPAGSWLTRDGIQRFPDGGTRRWIAPEAASDLLPLWIGGWRGQEVVLVRRGLELCRISHPEGDPEPLAAGIWEFRVFPDGRWIARRERGELLLGDPGGIRGVSRDFVETPRGEDVPFPSPGGALPLHEGVLLPSQRLGGEAFRIWWMHSSGELEALPPVHRKGWIAHGPWRIWPDTGNPSAVAIRRGGSLVYWFPSLRREDFRDGWARTGKKLVFFPPEDPAPGEVPLPPSLQDWWFLVGTLGERALVARPARGGQPGRLAAVRWDGAWKEWLVPIPSGAGCAAPLEGDEMALVFFQGLVVFLARDRVAWTSGPQWSRPEDLAIEVVPGSGTALIRVPRMGEAFWVDLEAPAIQRLGAL